MGTRRSYKGAVVRLMRDITTKGGMTFKEGVRMRVTYQDRFGLTLTCYVRGWPKCVSGVSRNAVEVIEWPGEGAVV